jgi:hypothetical protein
MPGLIAVANSLRIKGKGPFAKREAASSSEEVVPRWGATVSPQRAGSRSAPRPSDHPLVERRVVVDPPGGGGGGRPARRKFDARGPITMAAARCCFTGAPAPGHHARPTEVASCFAEWAEHPGPREARLRRRRDTAFISRRPRRGEDRKAFASRHGGHGYTQADLSASCPERPRTCLSPDRLGPRDARRMKPTW